MFRWFLTNSKVIEHLLFSKQADWVLKSKKQNTQTKPLYFVYPSIDSLSKIGHGFGK